jgi:hypothetical protein
MYYLPIKDQPITNKSIYHLTIYYLQIADHQLPMTNIHPPWPSLREGREVMACHDREGYSAQYPTQSCEKCAMVFR